MDPNPDSWTDSRKFFIKEAEAVNPDDDRSLELFEESLRRHKWSPLLLGYTEENQALIVVPGRDILDPQSWQLPVDEEGIRYPVSHVMLGVWFTSFEREAGKGDDGCIFKMDDVTPQLQVFLQLGAIFIAEEHQSFLEWKPTRYQLVANFEDGSLWVLRKPFVSVEDAVDKVFATENTTEVKWGSWCGHGGYYGDRIVFGRPQIKSTTNPPQTVLNLHLVHCKRVGDDDPVLCVARRTEHGGIGRTNDSSIKGKWNLGESASWYSGVDLRNGIRVESLLAIEGSGLVDFGS